MPQKSLRFCNHHGCNKLTSQRYCPEHMAEFEAKQKEFRNKYRESASDRGYDGTWSKVRKSYLNEHPLCEQCEGQGKLVIAVLVHHKTPIDQGGERLSKDNLMSLCRTCHERLHNRLK